MAKGEGKKSDMGQAGGNGSNESETKLSALTPPATNQGEEERKNPSKQINHGAPRRRKDGKRESTSVAKGTAWVFPKQTLEESIKLAQTIEEKNAGKPIEADLLTKYIGFKRSNDWRFLDRLRSANQYGLVTGSGEKATVTLEKTGEDIVAPSSPAQRQEALLKAFSNVDLFKKVSEYYKGKKIPEDEYFGNTLVREFSISRDRIEPFIKVFTLNLQYLKAFDVDREGKQILGPRIGGTAAKPAGEAPPEEEGKGVRQFLDTSFVLMPFGEWPNRYYTEIYVPAIKDAGFEPTRADDLFRTGSIMEQVWDEIQKAKVLLAELTGKNSNVFYELGLAHAAGKPVVFITGNLDDVPYDLRHLRVIAYDIREPNWGEKLRRDITSYLKNAKADPSKSIPQPFREIEDVSE